MELYTDVETKSSSVKKVNFSVVEHNDINITFETPFTITLGTNAINIFKPINEYIISVFSEDDKDKLFDLYSKAKTYLDPLSNPDCTEDQISHYDDANYLIHKLVPICNEILDLFNFDNLQYFLNYDKVYLDVPKSVEEAAEKGDYPPETTIYKEDYVNILKMIIYIRPIFPIIVNFINNVRTNVNEEYLYIVSGELFENNYIFKSLPGFNRLKLYMKSMQVSNETSKELDMLAEQHYNDFLIFKTLITKLFPTQIPSMDKTRNLSVLIYGGSRGLKGDKIITSPIYEKGWGDEEDKRSMFESLKIKAAVNQHHEMAQAEYFLIGVLDEYNNQVYPNPFEIQCKGLEINNPKLVKKFYDLIPDEWDFRLENHITTLGQLSFFGKISPEIVFSLDYDQLKSYMALAQAKLYEMGFNRLSLLMTSVFYESGVSTNTLDIFNLSKEERDKIASICYITTSDKTTTRNRAVEAVVKFLNGISSNSLVSTINLDMLTDGENNILNKEYVKGINYEVDIIRDIKDEFINLVMLVNQ